jgi:hypothetical protein
MALSLTKKKGLFKRFLSGSLNDYEPSLHKICKVPLEARLRASRGILAWFTR